MTFNRDFTRTILLAAISLIISGAALITGLYLLSDEKVKEPDKAPLVVPAPLRLGDQTAVDIATNRMVYVFKNAFVDDGSNEYRGGYIYFLDSIVYKKNYGEGTNLSILKSADKDTFETLIGDLSKAYFYLHPDYKYARDGKVVYYEGRPIYGADSPSFTVINNGVFRHEYGKDKNGVYFHDVSIQGVDPKTFEILWEQGYEGCKTSGYSKDASNVYWSDVSHTKTVEGADSKTFKIMINGYGKDKNSVYLNGAIQKDLSISFEPECLYG